MDYKALHKAAALSLENCQDRPRRLTLWFLLIAYGASAAVNVALLTWGEALNGVGGFDVIGARDRYYFWSTVLTVALTAFMHLWNVGYENFALRISRGERVSFSDLAAGLRAFGPFVLLYLLQTVFIALWSMLFVIPGIIAAYRYRLAAKLLLDHPEFSPLQAIRESKRLTYGHKLELFVLDLTFWLYFLLIFALEYWVVVAERFGLVIEGMRLQLILYFASLLLLLPVELYWMPKVQTAYAHAYDQICACNRERTMV